MQYSMSDYLKDSSMIKLDAHESILLLLLKGWNHKDVKKCPAQTMLNVESQYEYTQRVCNYLYGCSDKNGIAPHRGADLFSIYSSLAEKLLTVRQVLRAMEYIAPTRHSWEYTPTEALMSELTWINVDGKIKLDYSLVDPKQCESFRELLNKVTDEGDIIN